MPRPFFETLRDLRNGTTLHDLGEELAKIIEGVKQTGKSGELVLKIKIKPPKSGGISYFMLEDSFSSKIPKLDHGDTIFFPTKDGGISRSDQTQGELALRPVTIDQNTGEILDVREK
jgi:hypothetical protein